MFDNVLLLRVKWNNELRNNQMKIKKGFIKAIFLLNLSTFFGLFSFGQSDNYSEKLDRYRKSFFNTFFNSEMKLTAKSVYGKKGETHFSYLTKDSLSIPIDYEYYGRSYFRRQGVSFYIKINGTKLPDKSFDTLGCYFFFEYFHTNAYDVDSNVNRNDIWDSLGYLVDKAQDSVQKLPSHQLFLLKDIGQNKYFITSSKSSGVFKVSVKRRDIKFLQKNDHSVEEGKSEAIISFLSTLHYNYDVEGGMMELSLNQCYPLTD